MSTAQLEIYAWVWTRNALAAVETWIADEQPREAAPAQSPQMEQPERMLPDHFCQEWFGLWR